MITDVSVGGDAVIAYPDFRKREVGDYYDHPAVIDAINQVKNNPGLAGISVIQNPDGSIADVDTVSKLEAGAKLCQ